MTASLHKRPSVAIRLKQAHGRNSLLWGISLFLFCGVPLQAQQDNGDISSEQVENIQTEEAAQADKAPTTKSLYFLGEKPRLTRQEGPPVGAPVSILPRPFVKVGSVTVPEAPETASVDMAAPLGAEAKENIQPQNPDEGLVAEDMVDDTNQAAVSTDEQFLEVSKLDQLDPSGTGVTPAEEGISRQFWQGFDRNRIVAKYRDFAVYGGSPALKAIADRIALSGVALPSPADDADIFAVLDARLSILAATGNAQGYKALLDRLPQGRNWSGLARHFSNAYLMDGRLGEACGLASQQRERDSNPYWIRMAAFCHAAQANRRGADFELEVLSEVTEIKPSFYQLIDQILVEAEMPAGSVITAPAALSSGLRVDLLEAAMARLARSPVSTLIVEDANPLAVQVVLALPGLSLDARTSLMDTAIEKGWIRTEELLAYVKSLANNQASDMPHQGIAMLQPAEADGSGKTDHTDIRAFWAEAKNQRYAAIVAEGLLKLASDTPMTAETASDGIYVRAALLGNDMPSAHAWFTAFRAVPSGSSAAADRQLISFAPLAVVARLSGAPTLSLHHLKLWWQQQADEPDKFRRANLLFSVLDGLGHTVPEEAWQWLEEGPALTEGMAVSTALWRRLLLAASKKDQPEVLATTFRLLGGNGSAAIPAALAGSLVGTLAAQGLEKEARQIGLELLITQGL